jgi:hypothetical protein
VAEIQRDVNSNSAQNRTFQKCEDVLAEIDSAKEKGVG